MTSRRFCFFSLLFVFIPGLASAAWTPADQIDSRYLPPICRIINTDEEGISGCTGTLLGSHILLTNAHCFDGLKGASKTLVMCGYQGVDPRRLKFGRTKKGFKIAVDGVRFAESSYAKTIIRHSDWTPGTNELRRHDQAIIQLQDDLTIKPIRLISGAGRVLAGQKCHMYGFGLNLDGYAGPLNGGAVDVRGNDRLGILSAETNLYSQIPANYHLTATSLTELFERLVGQLTSPRATLTQSFVLPGDSGGPLLCADPTLGGEVIVTGIATSNVIKTPSPETNDADSSRSTYPGSRFTIQSNFIVPDVGFINSQRDFRHSGLK